MEELKLSQLLITKLCHDLSGSLGVINNCIDFLGSKNEDLSKKSQELVSEGIHNMINTLNSYRFAASIGISDETISYGNFKKQVLNLSKSNNISYNIHGFDDSSYFSSKFEKSSLALLSFILDVMKYEGSIDLSPIENGIILRASSNKVNFLLKNKVLESLTDEDSSMEELRNCYAKYIKRLCNYFGYHISIKLEKNVAIFELYKKS